MKANIQNPASCIALAFLLCAGCAGVRTLPTPPAPPVATVAVAASASMPAGGMGFVPTGVTHVFAADFPAQSANTGFFQVYVDAPGYWLWTNVLSFDYPTNGATVFYTNLSTNLTGCFRAGAN